MILGDRFGAACERWLIDAATDIFAAAGFVVARNAPFAGGYITQTYGRPQAGVQALQIEIDRALYMDEARIERLAGLRRGARRGSAGVVAGLAALGPRAAAGRGGIGARAQKKRPCTRHGPSLGRKRP